MKKLNINNQVVEVDFDEEMLLLWVIRDEAGLTGTKFGCGIAQCGACTVYIDRVPVRFAVIPPRLFPPRLESPRSKTLQGMNCIPCSRRGWKFRFLSEATASPDRSWLQRLC